MITFTKTAADKVKEILSDADDDCRGLRIRAMKLGNYTFRYGLQLTNDDDIVDNDVKVDAEGFSTWLDPESAASMQGTEIDFVEADGQAGFQINNPQAEPKWDDPVAGKVQTVLNERVIPALAQHGGWIELVEVKGGIAYVQLGGGCQGCSDASVTLNEGVKTAICQAVPEISDVVDRTDHSSGGMPFRSS